MWFFLPRRRQPEEDWCEEDDALSRDIAALLAYTGPAEKEKTDADS